MTAATLPRYRPGGPLTDAVNAGDTDEVRAALAEDEDVDTRDADGLTPLMIAAAHGRPDLVRLLLRAGADVLTTDARTGATALHKAGQGGSVEVARQLLAAGAFLDAVAAATGRTPLLEAVRFGRAALVAELLARGAHTTDPATGGSALHRAAAGGQPAVVGLLLGRVDPDLQSLADGYTALHEAVLAGHADCTRELIDAGAAVDLRGHDGRTPADLAREFCGDDADLLARLGTGR